MGGLEAGWSAGRRLTVPFGSPRYSFRATMPEAWEAWEARRLGGWLAGVLRYHRTHSEPLYIPLETRFLRPGRLGRMGGLEAGWLGC